jgi:hypothetical protein
MTVATPLVIEFFCNMINNLLDKEINYYYSCRKKEYIRENIK